MSTVVPGRTRWSLPTFAVIMVGVAVLIVGLVATGPLWLGIGRAAWPGVVVAVLHAIVMLGLLRRIHGSRAGPADLVTVARSMLGSVVLGVIMLALIEQVSLPTWWLTVPAGLAIVLDAVDGPVARRTKTASAAGGRYDMECDAMIIMIMSLAGALIAGPWALLPGALRYLFVIAGFVAPRLQRPLAYSALRRWLAAAAMLLVWAGTLPVLPHWGAVVAYALALGALVFSFGRDVVRLLRS